MSNTNESIYTRICHTTRRICISTESRHIKMSYVIYACVVSHMNESSKRMNESCRTICGSTQTSCHIWISHIWMRHHKREQDLRQHAVMWHIHEPCYLRMSHVTCEFVMPHTRTEYAAAWSHVTYEWVMSHMNESCHIWMSHVTYEW